MEYVVCLFSEYDLDVSNGIVMQIFKLNILCTVINMNLKRKK